MAVQPGGDPSPESSLSELERQAQHALDALDLSRVLYRVAAGIMDTTGFYLGLYDQSSGLIEIVRQVDHGEERPGGAFPLGSGFTSQVIIERRPILIEQWSQSGPPVHVRYATSERMMPESAVTVPILGVLKDEVLGVIAVQSFKPRAYGQRDLDLLTRMASVAARVIERWRAQERAQADLQRRTTELEGILAGMSEGLIITDQSGAVVRFNAVAREILAGPDGWIMVGAPLDQLVSVADEKVAAALATLVDGLRRGESAQLIEVDTVRDQRLRTLSLAASPLRDGAGGVLVIRDVTEHRALDRLRAQVLRVASHDLQNPITAIKGWGQMLLHAVETEPTTPSRALVDGVSIVVQQASRLSEMVRLLLDMSKVAADGRVEIQPAPTDLVALIGEMVEILRPVWRDHDFVIVAPPMLRGSWDAARLRQVLQNLVGNAVKYSPNGGRIEIRASSQADGVRVDISDEGIGLTPEDMTRVFEQFYRGSHATGLEGSGLGLYICQAIISAHGGRIWATSPGPNAGSTFSFVIPA